MDEHLKPTTPTVKHAMSAIAETAIDQARELVVAQLDRWAERIRQRLVTPEAEDDQVSTPPRSADPNSASPSTPVLIGVLAGATVAWLLNRHATKT